MDESDAVSERCRLIFQEAQRLVLAARNAVLIYIVAVSLAGVIADQAPDSPGLQFLVSGAQIGFGYYMLVEMISKGELALERKAGFGVYFGLSLLTGLGIGFGLLFLIIPGVFLFVRWAPVYPIGLVDGDGIGASMSKSFEITKPHFWPIFAALVPPIALQLIFALGYFSLAPASGPIPVPISLAGNLGISVALVAICGVCTAVYSLLRDRNEAIAAVFD